MNITYYGFPNGSFSLLVGQYSVNYSAYVIMTVNPAYTNPYEFYQLKPY